MNSEEARALVEQQARAWGRADSAAIVADFASDGALISPRGCWRGHDALRRAAESVFAAVTDVQVVVTVSSWKATRAQSSGLGARPTVPTAAVTPSRTRSLSSCATTGWSPGANTSTAAFRTNSIRITQDVGKCTNRERQPLRRLRDRLSLHRFRVPPDRSRDGRSRSGLRDLARVVVRVRADAERADDGQPSRDRGPWLRRCVAHPNTCQRAMDYSERGSPIRMRSPTLTTMSRMAWAAAWRKRQYSICSRPR